MKKFVCPVDARIVIEVEDDFKMTQIVFGRVISIANCETPLPNSACKMIAKGCVGCNFNKEAILNTTAGLPSSGA